MKKSLENEAFFTPREIVGELDKFIVGQKAAKRAVAIALRNRWRRQRIPSELRDEISPKNIILIGSTGVGKTEIARRLAKLSKAPFIKVEASKFTEVGYVGRDVDSMIRDLTAFAVQMVRTEERIRVRPFAEKQAEEHILDLLLPKQKTQNNEKPNYEKSNETIVEDNSSREKLRKMLRQGQFDEKQVEIDSQERRMPVMEVFSNTGLEEMGMSIQDMVGQITGPRKTRQRKVNILEARDIFIQEESNKLIDEDHVIKEAIKRVENNGIVFLDEIDKIAKSSSSGNGPDVSREGVQRDILPIVEGSSVNTKYGVIKTDHILFIAAGAFHVSKVSDLIPELQGRFPIRVELKSLGEKELLRILQEPQNSLPIQYKALLKTEKITLNFIDEGLKKLAQIAATANMQSQNIGARRLHTVFEKLLEDILFHAPERENTVIDVNIAYVENALKDILENEDLSRYIL